MKKRILFLILFTIAGMVNLTFGQVSKAKKLMALYNYSEALIILNKTIQEDDADKKEVSFLLAECYRKQNDVQQARGWYVKTIEYGHTDSATLFNYAQILRSCGDYQKAKEVFLKYGEQFPLDKRAHILAGFCDSSISWKDIPPAFEIKNAISLNSKQSDFGPVFYENGICFASDRLASKSTDNKYGWTGNGYLHLFNAQPVFIDDFYNDYKELQLAPHLFNQAYHDGPATFNIKFSEIFFNRTFVYRDKGKKDQDRIRTHLLKIYSSQLVKHKWTDPVPFFLNSNEYSIGHPALSKDGKILFFVSDMKGGFGGTDLYMCRREDVTWSQPMNLGPVINTFGNEMFPFLAENGDFYFASDGHPGFGGLDIYFTRTLVDSTWLRPQNLGQPVNSSYDDFSLCISRNNLNGLFSSNRPGGLGSDDLYLFRRIGEVPAPVSLISKSFLSGYVKDKTNLKPISGATVFVLDVLKDQALILKTDSSGYYRLPVIPGRPYRVKAMHSGYIADCYPFTPDTLNKIAEYAAPRDLLLDLLQNDKTFILENIYYDLDKWFIRADAQPALDKLVNIMKENPVNIELGSHTDSRASEAYNLELSQKRAESAVRYIVLQGVNPLRIKAKGYGETQIVNRCRDGVKCTEAEHQQNRRTEFKVISWYVDTLDETINLLRYKNGEVMDARMLPDKFFDLCQ